MRAYRGVERTGCVVLTGSVDLLSVFIHTSFEIKPGCRREDFSQIRSKITALSHPSWRRDLITVTRSRLQTFSSVSNSIPITAHPREAEEDTENHQGKLCSRIIGRSTLSASPMSAKRILYFGIDADSRKWHRIGDITMAFESSKLQSIYPMSRTSTEHQMANASSVDTVNTEDTSPLMPLGRISPNSILPPLRFASRLLSSPSARLLALGLGRRLVLQGKGSMVKAINDKPVDYSHIILLKPLHKGSNNGVVHKAKSLKKGHEYASGAGMKSTRKEGRGMSCGVDARGGERMGGMQMRCVQEACGMHARAGRSITRCANGLRQGSVTVKYIFTIYQHLSQDGALRHQSDLSTMYVPPELTDLIIDMHTTLTPSPLAPSITIGHPSRPNSARQFLPLLPYVGDLVKSLWIEAECGFRDKDNSEGDFMMMNDLIDELLWKTAHDKQRVSHDPALPTIPASLPNLTSLEIRAL
ncbi:uncharacterized protein EV420DRAFT_1651841 [Desarmillaria tabescens]|uniref:Uncharacterized protein n=1 Tax=Armillaria tabescens TaxID=1929756 RepID=A0AA39ML52_ARMTA|nr:uncharacterized protein EV420DRAFT_1651841 [Desarmillaria tabescens]KAK0437734.1 hypothetical protein EV420DRAFT_1651841 [Desarmillaria tabescens]